MALWQRPTRIGLATFAVAFGIAVLIGIRDRTPPALAGRVDRTDSEAVLESRQPRIVQRDAGKANLRIAAGRQLAYSDGSVKLIDDVTIEYGDGLVATTEEASYSDDGGVVTMPAETEFRRNGMRATGGGARYDRQDDVLHLEPQAVVELTRDDGDTMIETKISADLALVAQSDGYMQFEGDVLIDVEKQQMNAAEVRAAFDAESSRIHSLELLGNARILGTEQVPGQLRLLSAREISITYGTDAPEVIDMIGGARVELFGDKRAGQLHSMSASDINVTYVANVPGQVDMANGSRVELYGEADAAGATITSRAMTVGLRIDSAGFDVIRAQGDVAVALPPTASLRQQITAATMQIDAPSVADDASTTVIPTAAETIAVDLSDVGADEAVPPLEPTATLTDENSETVSTTPVEATADTGTTAPNALLGNMATTSPVLQARFDGGYPPLDEYAAVEYRETHLESEGAPAEERVIRAQRLDATFDNALGGMHTANFVGNMQFETNDVAGQAGQATYDVHTGTFTLITLGPEGQTPRVDDRRGSLSSQTIVVQFEGPDLQATGEVESVLASIPTDGLRVSRAAAKRPRLLAEGPPIYVTAGQFTYEAGPALATYSETARLWQNATEFSGETLILDELTGNVSAEGSVRTQYVMLQNDDETGEQVEATSRGRSESFIYDDASRRVTYTTDAELLGEQFRLEARRIDVILHEDARTLNRIVAVGEVILELDRRRVVGDTLTYFDADGRYEMSGEPVRIVEEIDRGVDNAAPPSGAPTAGSTLSTTQCRETTGRTVTFYVTAEAVSIDGQSEVRTQSTNDDCPSAP